jgi:hypothetical protein
MGAKGGENGERNLRQGTDAQPPIRSMQVLAAAMKFGGGKVRKDQAASWIACQMRCGVAGISIWVMP